MQVNRITSGFSGTAAVEKSAVSGFAAKLEQAAKQVQEKDDKKLRDTCREMESVFLNYMLTQMRATVPKNTLMGDNSKKEIMQSLLDTEMSKNMSQAGGIGLADMIYRQLSLANTKSQAPK